MAIGMSAGYLANSAEELLFTYGLVTGVDLLVMLVD